MAEIRSLWAITAHLQLYGIVSNVLNEGWHCDVILARLLPLSVALLQHCIQLLLCPLAPCKLTQSHHQDHMTQDSWREDFLEPVADRASYSILTKHQAEQVTRILTESHMYIAADF